MENLRGRRGESDRPVLTAEADGRMGVQGHGVLIFVRSVHELYIKCGRREVKIRPPST
jgi:hypothetical protein